VENVIEGVYLFRVAGDCAESHIVRHQLLWAYSHCVADLEENRTAHRTRRESVEARRRRELWRRDLSLQGTIQRYVPAARRTLPNL
jgi:hypothetical protein